MKTTAVLLSLVASSMAAGDEPDIAGGVNKAGGNAGGNKPDIAGGFAGDRAGGRKKECFFKPSKCSAACTLTFDTTKTERGLTQDTSKCVIPEFTKGTEECFDGDCDFFNKKVTKSSADVTQEKKDVCGTFTATTKSSCEQGIQDKEDAKDPAAFFAKCETAAGSDNTAKGECATKKTALEKPHEELDQDAKDKKLSDKMKECVAKKLNVADAKSCRDKVIDEAVGEAAAIGDFINKDELTQKAERDYDQQDRIADAKNPDTICSRLAVGSAALTKCTKCRVTDVAAIAVLDTAIAGMPTSTDEEKAAKATKVAAKATKEAEKIQKKDVYARCTKCRVDKTDDAECTATKDPERALMDCLVRGTAVDGNMCVGCKAACKAAAVIDTAVKSGKTTDEAVGSDFTNMFKDIEREFDQQKAAKVLTDAAGGCKSKSSKELRNKCFDDRLKIEAAKTDAKPLAELKREVEEAAVDGKVTHFL